MNKQANQRVAARLGAIVLALIVGAGEQASAFTQPDKPPTASFDKRRDALPSAHVSAERQRAEAELQARRSSTRVGYDAVTGAPAWISRPGFLSKATEDEIQRTGGLGLANDDPHRAIKAFLVENAALFGHGTEVLSNATIRSEFVTEHNGMRTVVWHQQLDGIPVFEGVLTGHITKRGQLVNLSSYFMPDIENAAGLDRFSRLALESAPAISAAHALADALTDLGETASADGVTSVSTVSSTPEKQHTFTAAPLLGEARGGLVWLPMNRSSARLCWCVQFMSRSTGEGFQTLVDASSGEVLVRQNRTCNFTSASYRVYISDSPSPFTPGWATPSSAQPTLVARQLQTLAALSQTASPQGWIRDTDNLTLGNNVDASVNRSGLIPNPTPRPQGSPFRVFDFPRDLNDDPTAYSSAAAVNFCYWCNWMHDKLYALGFTEAARNFQDDNFGRGGVPGDRVLAYAQFGADTQVWWNFNNASFTTWPDGTPGVMRMHLWTYPIPKRDGDLDAEFMLHEYTHGLSNRRVGGGVGIDGLNYLQAGGLGEGWSDFYALALLSQSSDNVNANYPMGGYVAFQLGGLTQNYYYGIRRYPYSTDMTKNPVTFNDIDPFQFDNCASSAPFNTAIFGACASVDPSEVHNIGEVWCVTLWEARKNLIDHYGFSYGNNLMLQLVSDGMNLSPANPNFTQARDAILLADLVDNCSRDWADLWTAFAKRGLGWYAIAPDSWTTSGVTESFVMPPYDIVDPCGEY